MPGGNLRGCASVAPGRDVCLARALSPRGARPLSSGGAGAWVGGIDRPGRGFQASIKGEDERGALSAVQAVAGHECACNNSSKLTRSGPQWGVYPIPKRLRTDSMRARCTAEQETRKQQI